MKRLFALLALLTLTALPVHAQPDPKFKTGAKPTPPHVIAAKPRFTPVDGFAAPTAVFYVPAKLSVWGNDQYGDCVTAEEAAAKACYLPEIFIEDEVVIDHARRHGVLNGAQLDEVLDTFQNDGFKVGSQRYNDGPYSSVQYGNPAELRAALARGPVKIAIASGSLPQGAGNHMGWYKFGGPRNSRTDHCVSLFGFGTAGECFKALKVPAPAGVDENKADCYLLFTWGTIGVVDQAWLNSTCVEAWIRNPTTVGVPPLTPPAPPPMPPPGPTPPLPPVPPVSLRGVIALGIVFGLAVVVLIGVTVWLIRRANKAT